MSPDNRVLVWMDISSHRIQIYFDEIKKFRKYLELARIQYSNDSLFKSRQGSGKAISRVQAYRIINKIVRRVGLKDMNCGNL